MRMNLNRTWNGNRDSLNCGMNGWKRNGCRGRVYKRTGKRKTRKIYGGCRKRRIWKIWIYRMNGRRRKRSRFVFVWW